MRWGRVDACVLVVLAVGFVSACGSVSSHEGAKSKAADVNSASISTVEKDNRVVPPYKVPGQLKRTGLKIVFRKGTLPTGIERAIYGVATNSHGRSVDFAFFLTGNDRARLMDQLAFNKFIPHATDEGSKASASFIEASNAGYGRALDSVAAEEELEITGTLYYAVARLAPRALKESGP